MEDRELGINLIIDGISYPLTIKASEEPYYRQAARMVNNTLSLYKEIFTGEEGVRVMTMVALDIAFNAIKSGELKGIALSFGLFFYFFMIRPEKKKNKQNKKKI